MLRDFLGTRVDTLTLGELCSLTELSEENRMKKLLLFSVTILLMSSTCRGEQLPSSFSSETLKRLELGGSRCCSGSVLNDSKLWALLYAPFLLRLPLGICAMKLFKSLLSSREGCSKRLESKLFKSGPDLVRSLGSARFSFLRGRLARCKHSLAVL